MFSSALSFLGGQNKHDLPNPDEPQLMGSHQALYGGGGGGGQAHTADTMGAGAAMQALKVSIDKMATWKVWQRST
jgi:hypothetical protein